MSPGSPRRSSRWLAPAALVAGLVLATWPTWRILMLGDRPTLDELLQLICSSSARARLPASSR